MPHLRTWFSFPLRWFHPVLLWVSWLPCLEFPCLCRCVHSYLGAREILERKGLGLKMGLLSIRAKGGQPSAPAGCFASQTRWGRKHDVPRLTCKASFSAGNWYSGKTAMAFWHAKGEKDTTCCPKASWIWALLNNSHRDGKSRVVWKKKKKNTPPQRFWVWSSAISNINPQAGARSNSKGYALKDPQAASSSRDTFLWMLAPRWGRCPAHVSSTMGTALEEPPGQGCEDTADIDEIQHMLQKPMVVLAPVLSYGWRNRPSFSGFGAESDGDSSIRNRKPRWKASYSSQSSALPWRCVDDAYHQFWGRREKSHPRVSLSRCGQAVMSPWRTWELSPHPSHTCMHILGGIYLNARI